MWKQRLQQALHRLQSDDTLGLGSTHAGAWTAKLVQTRRYSRIFHVLPPEALRDRLRQRLDSEALVLKLYHVVHAERRQQEFADLCRVHKLAAPHLRGTVVHPVAVYADLGALLTVLAAGDEGAAIVRRACRMHASLALRQRAEHVCTRAGVWLRSFQSHAAVRPEAQSPHLATPEAFVAYVEVRLQRMRTGPFGLGADEVAETLAQLRRCLQPQRDKLLQATWSHSDFGPHNLLVRDDGVTVLDFELLPQHPWFDAAYFVESLAGFTTPHHDAGMAQRLQRSFLQAYGVSGDEALFVALRLRHLVCTAASLRARRTRLGALRWPQDWLLRRRLRSLCRSLAAHTHAHEVPLQMA